MVGALAQAETMHRKALELNKAQANKEGIARDYSSLGLIFHSRGELDQAEIDKQFEDADILTNCRRYPMDEAPAAYKDFNEVLNSVKGAGLASEVARLRARFVIKDASDADD